MGLPLLTPTSLDIENLFQQSFNDPSASMLEGTDIIPTESVENFAAENQSDPIVGQAAAATVTKVMQPQVMIPLAVRNEMVKRKRPSIRKVAQAKRQKPASQAPEETNSLPILGAAADSVSVTQMETMGMNVTSMTKMASQTSSSALMMAKTNETASTQLNNGRISSFEYIRDTYEALIEPVVMSPIPIIQPISCARVKAHLAKLIFLNNAYNEWCKRVQVSKDLTINDLSDIMSKGLLEAGIASL